MRNPRFFLPFLLLAGSAHSFEPVTGGYVDASGGIGGIGSFGLHGPGMLGAGLGLGSAAFDRDINDQIDAQLKRLKTADPSAIKALETEIQVLDRIRDLENDVDRWASLPTNTATLNESKKELEVYRKRIEGLVTRVKSLDCSKANSQDELVLLATFQIEMDRRPRNVQFRPAASDPCHQAKGLLELDPLAEIDAAITRTSDAIYALTARKTLLEELAAVTVARKAELWAHHGKLNERNDLARNLLWIIGLIGVLSISVIAAVRFFDQGVQQEWIGSGQVVQFVTVMVLLSTVLVLGLSEVLHENTLGTILGGVGGYVLSQGIGRAAAHNAVREQRQEDQSAAVRSQRLPGVHPPPPGPVAPPAGAVPPGQGPSPGSSTPPAGGTVV